MTDLIVKAAVRDQLKEKSVASDFYDALDDEVATVLKNAARRADKRSQNNPSTRPVGVRP